MFRQPPGEMAATESPARAWTRMELDPRMPVSGTKLPIWDVVATVASEGNPDITRAAQFSRE